MYSIVWFDPNFEEGRLRMIHGQADTDAATEHADQIVEASLTFEVVLTSELPLTDRTFRNAWTHDVTPSTEKIGIDLPKAAGIAHVLRRRKRDEEFAPHDNVIAKQIPGADTVAAEAARAAIRTKYDVVQVEIDAASDAAILKSVLVAAGVV